MKRFFAVIGFLAVFPFFLSRRSRVRRSTWIDARPEEIFPLLNAPKFWPLWTEWSSHESMETRYEGPEAGAGAVQHWKTRHMEGALKIVGNVLDRRVSYDLEIGKEGSFKLEGVLALESVGGGTRVTWTCWWIGGQNPYMRYKDLAMRFFIGKDFGAGLNNLKELVGAVAPSLRAESIERAHTA